jgi:two-component system, response regulator YesN
MEKMCLLVADDSGAELDCITYLVDKYGFPLEIETAGNGRDALNLIYKHPFDLLLTDIKMPYMDGLTLAREALDVLPDLKIAIVSGFNEFDFAKTAIVLGVKDYLLKPIDPDEFKAVMERMIRGTAQCRTEKLQWEQNKRYAKQYVLQKLICGITAGHLLAEEEAVSLEFLNGYSHMALLETESKIPANNNISYDMYLKSHFDFSFDPLNISQTQTVFFLHKDGEKGEYLKQGQLVCAAENLCRDLKCDYHASCKIALSGTICGQPFAEVYSQLESLLEKCFFFPENTVLTLDMCQSDELDEALNSIDNIESDIHEGNIDGLQEHMEQLFVMLCGSVKYTQNYIKLLFANILSEIIFLFPPEKRPPVLNLIQSISTVQDLNALILIIRGVMRPLQAVEASGHAKPLRSDIIKQFISEHYGEDLGLEELAKAVYVHPHYLCRMFKKETGLNLNKFVKSYRMEKARDLLYRTPMKINAISKAVGYQNLSYFCQNFREFYGISPEKYRKKGDVK